jgi:hypothetical protein
MYYGMSAAYIMKHFRRRMGSYNCDFDAREILSKVVSELGGVLIAL